MGMSIEKAIEIINHYLDYPKEEVRKALLVAIEIMRKYQKIEQIYNSWRTGDYKGSKECMEDMGEVLEDGNNTTNPKNN